jgi:hypothetical protein
VFSRDRVGALAGLDLVVDLGSAADFFLLLVFTADYLNIL